MTFRPFHYPAHLYFVTGTITRWLSIFQHDRFIEIILESLKWHRQNKRMKLFAFVIMPNHLHWISYPIAPNTINDTIRSFASFTAHEILRVARILPYDEFLLQFSQYTRNGKKHRIWMRFQAKNIFSEHFLHQKMEYIHNNPVNTDWFLHNNRSKFKLSSACFYDDGIDPIIPIDDLYEYLVNPD